jgi:membrane-associated phospholipid phosphatase
VINPLSLPQHCAAFAMVNPLGAADKDVAAWFHAHLSHTFVTILRALSEPGSGMWIGIVVFFGVLFFVWKRWWPSLVMLVVAVPGGMLLNEWVKILVHRPRPFLAGPFVDWSGYSFASGHTIGATLLYGQLALFVVPAIKSLHWQRLIVLAAALLVLLVGFSRIALGAHYLTDVLAAIVFGILWLAFCLIAGKPMRRRVAAEHQLPIGEPLNGAEIAVLAVQQTEQPAQNLLR